MLFSPEQLKTLSELKITSKVNQLKKSLNSSLMSKEVFKSKLKELVLQAYKRHNINFGAGTFPVIQNHNDTCIVEHEASASKLSKDTLFYLATRGFGENKATNLVVLGQCRQIFTKLPMEFALEAKHLIESTLDRD